MKNRFERKSVLVTGGAGFVGSNLIRALVKEGAEVTILDDLFTGNRENLSGIEPMYKFVEGSVVDLEKVMSLVSKNQIIFHLAARNIIASTKDPFEDYRTNIGGTLNVLQAARKYRPERVVYTSSASVYGNPKYLPINEDDRISLLTPYSVSKFSGEGYCQAFYESYNLSITVLRYSNIFGTGQDPMNPYCGVVAKFMQSAQQGRFLEIHGDGQQTRDFTYIEDAVEATILSALSAKADGEIFNVATGIETSVNALASSITELYGIKTEVDHIERRDIDNIRRRVLNIEKIRRKIGWIPNVTLLEGLRRTKEWFGGLN